MTKITTDTGGGTSLYYLLDDDNNAVPCDDVMEWAKFFEGRDRRRVARNELDDGTIISTVFLGIEHNFSGVGAPEIFETMVFKGGDYGEERYCKRCGTWEKALKQHDKALAWAIRHTGSAVKHEHGQNKDGAERVKVATD